MHSKGAKENLLIKKATSSDEEEFCDDEMSDPDDNEEMLYEALPYNKTQKFYYVKYHAKFLGSLSKKSTNSYYMNAFKWTCD